MPVEPLTPEREAELRRLATDEDWSPAQHEDLAELFTEIDRLRVRLEDANDELEFLRPRATEH